ncbi:MAG: phosphate ABC transporter permease subunit PstC [Candidatus Riflebacteria bacterium]|nr:phosphate ABC transporter permease subunit PstC [Candidatus Riflebacteria bacterium]
MKTSILYDKHEDLYNKVSSFLGNAFLLSITVISACAVLFIFYFIVKDSILFFQQRELKEFFFSTQWFPSREPAEFGAGAIFWGSFLVTAGACAFAIPIGLMTAVCLSDILPFSARQILKPLIEILAAIPSVAYGFFALVVVAPLLQEKGGLILSYSVWALAAPVTIFFLVLGDVWSEKFFPKAKTVAHITITGAFILLELVMLYILSRHFSTLKISSGTNALNASLILGIMILPTIASVSEDALQSIGRELREGSYALGATRAETLLKVVIPAASPGILAAVILGIMRAIGETMVVWMASGNTAKIPNPCYNFFEPIRTLTATIAGDMGEADHVSGSMRYHVLFAMATCMLIISFALNITSEWIMKRTRKRVSGA